MGRRRKEVMGIFRKREGMIVSLVVAALLVGLGIGSLQRANNASAEDAAAAITTQDSSTATAPTAAPDPTKGGHTANGVTEELLTGETAAKVKEAALAAVPNGTVQRAETDAEGAVYEAHMTNADGSPVTIFFDAAYHVTGQAGGPGGHGGQRPTQQQ